MTAWDLLVAGDTDLVDAGVDGGIQLYANQPGGALAWQAELPSLTGLSAWGSLGEMAWLARSDGALLALDLSEAIAERGAHKTKEARKLLKEYRRELAASGE